MENLIFAAIQAAGTATPDQFELFMIREDIYGFPIKFLLVGLGLITFLILRKNRTAAEFKKIAIAGTMFVFFWAAIFSDVWRSHREFLRLCHQAAQIEREENLNMDVNPDGGLIKLGIVRCKELCLTFMATDFVHFVEIADFSDENTFAGGHGSSYQSGPVRRYWFAPTEGLAADIAEGCRAGKSKIARRDATDQYLTDYARSPCLMRERGEQGTAQYSLESWRQPLEAPYSIITQNTARIIDRNNQKVVTSFTVYTLHLGQVEAGIEAMGYINSSPVAVCKAKTGATTNLIERLRNWGDTGNSGTPATT